MGLKDCDVVMKGGITSALVYPPAIEELSSQFRFCGIGGASAGAIAAAAAACAEVGRATGGFAKLAEIRKESGESNFLTRRFRPDPHLAPVFEAFRAYLDWRPRPDPTTLAKRPWHIPSRGESFRLRIQWIFEFVISVWALGSIVFRAQKFFAVAALSLGVLTALFLADAFDSRWPVGFSLLAVFVGLLTGFTLAASRLLALSLSLNNKSSGFGVCSGSLGSEKCNTKFLATLDPPPKCDNATEAKPKMEPTAVKQCDPRELPLTDWLHVRLNGMAGLPASAPSPTLGELKLKHGIDVKLMTTDVSLELPMLLPSTWGDRSFFYREEEFSRLFPEPVVAQLRAWNDSDEKARESAGKSPLRFKDPKNDRLLRLPMGGDLPLLVAVRMSLSFPVLLSAIRLYSLTEAKAYQGIADIDGETNVEEHWFSDGGIGSNFPIHVFDSWLPARPTFGITLYDATSAERELPRNAVVLPAARSADKARARRTAINGMVGFLTSVFETAKNFRDTLQSCLPSYRERIVQVFLAPGEGGLNLNMNDADVQSVTARGEAAGKAILEAYGNGTDGFQQHQWVRLRVLLHSLDSELTQLKKLDPAVFTELVATAAKSDWYLKPKEEDVRLLQGQLALLTNLISKWQATNSEAPTPSGHLRVTPDL